MDVRKCECDWCERTYAVKDSTASNRDRYCSEECEAENKKAFSECGKWLDEIEHAWRKLKEEYEPGEDEDDPRFDSDTPCRWPENKRMYLAFKTRYQKWKGNHCWKKSFWAWDEDSGGSFFGGGGGGSGAEGCVKVVLKLIGILVAVWIGWAVIKGVWNGIFGGGGSEEITEAAIMAKWEEHLEKRREAFDDGKPEKEIEANGLRNYTWDEWQAKFKKEHEAADKPKADKKEVKGEEGSVTQKAKEIGEQALSASKGLGDKAKSLWQNLTSNPMADLWHEHQDKRRKLLSSGMDQKKVEDMGYEALTFDEFKARYKDKNVEAELKRLNSRLAELEGPATSSKKSSKSTSYKVTMTGNEATVTVTSENDTRQDAWQAAIRTAVKGAVSAFVGNRKLIEANKDSLEKCLYTVSKADLKRCNVIKDLQVGEVFTVVIEARIDKKDIAPKFARVFPDAFTMSKVAAPMKPTVPASNAELEAKAQAEAAARARAEAEAKRLANEMARKNAEAEARIKAEAVARAKAEAEAKRLAEELARKDAAAKAQAEAATRTKADAKAKAPTGAEGAVGGQQSGGAVRKASKDSKGIRIIVQGKGKTMDAAVRWAIRDAVWRTVGTWVDSKTRIKENHDRLLTQVKTITEADVHKFEVLDTQMQDGGFIIKVRVSVSKKKIAPKFAEIFPDVFGNVND